MLADGSSAAIGGVFFLFFALIYVAIFAVAIGGTILWIIALVELLKYPEPLFRMIGKERMTWVLVVALLGALGGIIYWLGLRKQLKAADAEVKANGWPAWMYASPYPSYPGYPAPPPVATPYPAGPPPAMPPAAPPAGPTAPAGPPPTMPSGDTPPAEPGTPPPTP